MSLDSTNPQNLFGGVWEQIKDKFLMPAGDTYKAGSTGGSAEQTLLVENMPAHTHTRGTMNITGELNYNQTYSGNIFSSGGLVGAFTSINTSAQDYYVNGRSTGGGWPENIIFDASRTWTGETSSVGGGASFSVMPPYMTVYVWKRIA